MFTSTSVVPKCAPLLPVPIHEDLNPRKPAPRSLPHIPPATAELSV